MINGLEFTCENCPFVNIVDADLKATGTIGVQTGELPAMSEVVRSKLLLIVAIEKAAQLINCRNKIKLLPAMPEPLPPVGHPERIAYGRLCPAYVYLRENSTPI